MDESIKKVIISIIHFLCTLPNCDIQLPWNEYDLLVVITSSTGDGDPPDNATKLWQKLRAKNLKNNYLAHIYYALLGLGDTNYTTFCGFPKLVDKQLQQLGAKKIYESKWADDAVGLENTVDPWIENLWSALAERKLSAVPAEPKKIVPLVEKLEIHENEKSTVQAKLKVEENKPSPFVDNTSPVPQENLGSLTVSLPNLQSCDLKVPVLPEPFLMLEFNKDLNIVSISFGH